MTTLESLEESNRHHEARLNLLADIAERQQALLERLELNIERLDRNVERLDRNMERLDRNLEEQQKEVAEYRRDTRQYQRLWVHLAQKHGWLDEDDWPPPEEGE